MHRLLPLLLLLPSCDDNPYAGGGEYPVDRCSSAEQARIANEAGEALWREALGDTDGPQVGRTRDFALLDEHGYRVRLTHFCGHTVLLVSDRMPWPPLPPEDEDEDEDGSGDTDAPVGPCDGGPDLDLSHLDWLRELPDWLEGRADGPPVTVMSTWWGDSSGEAPSVGELRRFRDAVTCQINAEEGDDGGDPWVYTDPGTGLRREVLLLQDPWRFQGAAAAASAMYVVSDVPPDPDPSRRYRREREVRDRWRLGSAPGFVVLQPALRITALGRDPVQDGIIDALRADPGGIR